MEPGEYATLYSSDQVELYPSGFRVEGPFCNVFATLTEAEEDARRQVSRLPALRCRIYDHHGLGRSPVREICGPRYKGEEEFSGQFRRWAGWGLLVGGLVLVAVDWHADFSLLWPAMFGTRMIPAGLIFLVIELVIWIEVRRKKSK